MYTLLAQAETSWIRWAMSISAMAVNISAELLSGKVCTMEVQPFFTIRDLKETMKQVFYPGDDGVTRKLRSVKLVLDGEKLKELETPIPAMAEGSKVQVVFSMKPTVECASAAESGYPRHNLFDVKIPDGVTRIDDYAFAGCDSLVRVTIPHSVTDIGESAFFVCSSLTSLTIPNSVRQIGISPFRLCKSLTRVIIPQSVTIIEQEAFQACFSLTSVVIPQSVTDIGAGAFLECSSLRSVTIPDSVTRIGSGAFRGSSLTSVRIPRSVAQIGRFAFCGCSSLRSIAIPNVQTQIGTYAFHGCRGLPFYLRVKRQRASRTCDAAGQKNKHIMCTLL